MLRTVCPPEEYACARALATEPGLLLPAEAIACMQQSRSVTLHVTTIDTCTSTG